MGLKITTILKDWYGVKTIKSSGWEVLTVSYLSRNIAKRIENVENTILESEINYNPQLLQGVK